jgi:hypothetical protein
MTARNQASASITSDDLQFINDEVNRIVQDWSHALFLSSERSTRQGATPLVCTTILSIAIHMTMANLLSLFPLPQQRLLQAGRITERALNTSLEMVPCAGIKAFECGTLTPSSETRH